MIIASDSLYRCPSCRGRLTRPDNYFCQQCNCYYPVEAGIPRLTTAAALKKCSKCGVMVSLSGDCTHEGSAEDNAHG